MNKATSIYLDFVRFFAAVMVFLSHACFDRFHGEWLRAVGQYGRDAVIVFFVLSGFVIAHVVSGKEDTGKEYAISRLARLYSVVLPALVLTVICDAIGSARDPNLYQLDWFETSHPMLRFLANLFLANEFWFESIRPFSNGPFWSLSYEASYYLIFGLLVYLKAPQRWLFAAIACAIVGPKILLLWPIWLMGVGAYRVVRMPVKSAWLGWTAFLGSLLAYYAYVHFDVSDRLLAWSADAFGRDLVFGRLQYSKFFVASYLLGAIVAVNFIGFSHISEQVQRAVVSVGRPIQWLAGFTFSLYLMHYPLLQVFATLTDRSALIISATLTVILVIGTLTEKRKSAVRVWIARSYDFIERRLPRPVPA